MLINALTKNRNNIYSDFHLIRLFQINSNSIKLLYNDKLRPTGEALVTFATLEDAHRAVVENNRKPMGNRYVELLLI